MMPKKIRYFLCILISICAVTQVAILNRHSTSGEQLSEILANIAVVEKSNETLSAHIASTSALRVIAEKSTALGLKNHAQTLSLVPVPPLALANTNSL